MSRLESENIKLKNEIRHSKKLNNEHSDDIYNLEKGVSNLQQYTRRWNVDVTQENLKPTVVRTLGQMDVAISENDIEIVHRLSKQKGSKYPANIIVRFKDRNNTFLRLYKTKRKTVKLILLLSARAQIKKYLFTKISAPCIRTFMSSALHREKEVNYIKCGQ